MTNEEAIKEIRSLMYDYHYSDTREAFELAIETLKEKRKIKPFIFRYGK